MKEFVCPDGTMSVNGVCRMFMTPEERESLKVSPTKSFNEKYQSIEDIPISQGTIPKTDIFSKTPKTIRSSKIPETITSSKTPQILDTKKFVDEYKSKEASASNIDKVIDSVSNIISPIEDKISQIPKGFNFDFEQVKETKQTADNIISTNTNYYNDYVENKLGISTKAQEALRFGSAAYGLATGGGMMSAIGPFALPVILGGAIKSADNKRIENITMQDPQGALNNVVSPRIVNMQPTARDIAMGGGGGGIKSSSSPSKSYSAPHQTSGAGGLHSNY